MREVLNKVEQGILVINHKGNILFANNKIKKLLGYESNDLEFKNIYMLLEPIEQKGYWLSDLEHSVSISIKDYFEEVQHYEIRSQKSFWEGTESIFLLLKKIEDEVFTYEELNDCMNTFPLSIEEVYRKNEITEEELKNFLETATDLMGIMAYGGRFLKVTSAWTEKLGWTEEELLQMSYKDLVHEGDKERTIKYAEEHEVSGEDGIIMNRYKCKNGNYIWLEWTCRVIMHRKVVICTIKDMSKEKQVEIERMKNEVLSNVSHEFKTPLNIILAMSQLIQKNIEDGNIQCDETVNLVKHLGVVKQNTYRLLRLINNIVDQSRIDAGYYKLNLRNYNIIELVEDITMSVVDYTKGRGIEIIFDTEVEELKVACDSDKIERIILNLLSNAMKYSNENSEIAVNIILQEENIIICVKDNGVGIPENMLESIFERFVQVEGSVAKTGQSSGIGLSLVKALVELHRGEVWAESVLGEGTSVFIKLPIYLVEQEEEKKITNILTSKVEKCIIEFADIYSVY